MGVCAYDYREKRNLLQRIGHGRQFGKLCKEFEEKLSLFALFVCHFCKTSPFPFFVMTCWEVAMIHCIFPKSSLTEKFNTLFGLEVGLQSIL